MKLNYHRLKNLEKKAAKDAQDAKDLVDEVEEINEIVFNNFNDTAVALSDNINGRYTKKNTFIKIVHLWQVYVYAGLENIADEIGSDNVSDSDLIEIHFAPSKTARGQSNQRKREDQSFKKISIVNSKN